MAFKMKYKNFNEFYTFYLTQHQHPLCIILHCVGTLLALVFFIYFLITQSVLFLIAAPIAGYSFAWVGHMAFEKNRPATFKNPFYSLLADFILFKKSTIQILKNILRR